MTQSTAAHTTGAMKAARAIAASVDEQLTAAGMVKLSGRRFIEECAADFAPIIDRETAAPEMAQALRVAQDWFERIPTGLLVEVDQHVGLPINEINAALRKAGY